MSDDMGYADLSCYGSKNISTPNIDKLATEGIKFMQAYAAAPVCTPTRVAFMTGRYPAHTPIGLKEPLIPTHNDSTFGLSAKYPSIAGILKTTGYKTALIGKWHLGFLPQFSPLKNGFDYFFGIHSGAADYISHKGYGSSADLYENESPAKTEGYLTDLFTRKAVEYIKDQHTAPFFLALTYNAPHWPWQAPGDNAYPDSVDYRTGGSKDKYASMMKSMDDGIGEIMKAVEENNLSANTIIIFTNDNGGERYSDNSPFANGKMSLWEGGIRVPAIIRWKGKIKPGTTTQQPAITMDWTATILAAAGADVNPQFQLDGIDLMPICLGKQKEIERNFYWRTFQRVKQKALRQGNWKYLQVENEEFLFNLDKDPGEKNNLKQLNAAIFNAMKHDYARWENYVLQPLPL